MYCLLWINFSSNIEETSMELQKNKPKKPKMTNKTGSRIGKNISKV